MNPIGSGPGPESKIIAHSVYEGGPELFTIQERFWNPLLAERNTHRNQNGNTASLRAMSFEEILYRFEEEPVDPIEWLSEQRGMQGGAPLTGDDLEDAQATWWEIKESIADHLHEYLARHPDKSTRLHKSLLNRLLTVGLNTTRVTTATSWQNYLDQRCGEDAQKEIQAVALLTKAAMEASVPTLLGMGQWHLPFITDEDREQVGWDPTTDRADLIQRNADMALCAVSVARTARVSYETQEGVRDMEEDFRLYHRLVKAQAEQGKAIHWSPLEQVATPDPTNRQKGGYSFYSLEGQAYGLPTDHLPRWGNLLGWRSRRVEVEAAYGAVTHR